MESNALLHWEMFGPGTSLICLGTRTGDAFELTVSRGGTSVATTTAADLATLLRRSSAIRESLQQQGYATGPLNTVLGGGLCWGPEAPLGTSFVAALQA